MKNNDFKHENGTVEVEATIIMPIVVLAVVMLVYLSLFMFQKANLQAALETTLVYYKNLNTDSFLVRNDSFNYDISETERTGSGYSYYPDHATNPYAKMFSGYSQVDNEQFRKYFDQVAGNMLFNHNLEVYAAHQKGLITDQYEAVAVQKIKFPMDLSLIGVAEEYEIHAFAKVAVVNNDLIIQDIDFAYDLVRASNLSTYIDNFKEKVVTTYQNIKNTLHLN